MAVLGIDVETYSSVDLTAAGVHKYADSDDFTILLFGFAVDDDPVEVVDIADGQKIPRDVITMLTDPGIEKTAYNAQFERTTLSRYLSLPMPPEQWSCSLVLAAQAGLPLGLDAVCKALGLPPDEAKADGRALITYFSKPCKPTLSNRGRTRNMPWDDYERWERYKSYNKRDVEVERTIRKRLAHLKPTETEHKFWCLDQKINDRGVKLDRDLINNAIGISETYTARLTDRAIRLSGITNVKSQQQIKAWLEKVEGTTVESLNKKALPDVLANLKTEEAKEFLDLRSELAKTSVAKFEKMQVCACKDDHARGLFQFYGANRTGRFAGRLLQVQNLPQNHIEDIAEVRSLVRAGSYDELSERHPNINSTLSELIRTAIIPEDGCRFIIADYSAIEARVIAWFAKEEDDLEEFKGAGKIYELTASRMFGVPKERIVKGNPEYDLRAKGKVATLACIAEGELVLTNRGLVPIEQVKPSDKLWDGENWVAHEGVVCNGVKEVITYDGLTATEDHIVWVEGQHRPIRFGDAASSGAHLLQSGAGRKAIRLGENHIAGASIQRALVSVLCSDRMHKLRGGSVDIPTEPDEGNLEGLSEMFAAKADTFVARPQTDSGEAKMREPKRSRVRIIRRAWGKIRFSLGHGSWPLDAGALRKSEPCNGDRPNRHECELRAWKSALGYPEREHGESSKHCAVGVGPEVLALRSEYSNEKAVERHDEGRDYRRCEARGFRETEMLGAHRRKARVYDIRNAGRHHRFTVSGKLVHNCGYGGGKQALVAMGALRSGIQEEELPSLVKQWRDSHRNIVDWWRFLEDAAKRAIRTKASAVDPLGHVRFDYEDNNLFMVLPSGRRIAYVNARIGQNRFGNTSILYAGQNQVTKKWEMLETYGGKLAENCVQATARDCLRDAMMNLDAEGFDVRMHVHDEVIINEPIEGRSLEDVIAIMRRTPDWIPGLPLNAAGFVSEFYMKD